MNKVLFTLLSCFIFIQVNAQKFVVPVNPRATYNFNPDWKFTFGDSVGADQPGFDDSKWAKVSLPHTWNETDSYRAFISHGGGDQSEKMFGIGWYRKHFKLPVGTDGQKVFLQFDGMRQAGRFFLNGQPIGKYENGVTAVGFDITTFVKYGGKDNVLAVQVDNSTSYKEEATGTSFQWNSKDFNPNFGGLNRNATLIVASKIYQSLPLYENLKTTGIYVYPESIDLKKKTADLKVEAEVVNETADYASITLSAVVVDADGMVVAKMDGNTSDLVANQSELFTATGTLTGARFWDVNDPYLYKVYTMLNVNGKVVDVCETTTGFRQTEFKGGVGTGGVWLNGRFVWLRGYAQRSANDWAGLGGAYPNWMHDFTLSMLRESNGNYMRWMHVAPQKIDVEACDRLGIVEVCPAGDKERLVTGRQWDQRVEVMRATMILYRNNPSIFFWEAGNTIVTPEQMVQMVALRKELDPFGGRVMGTRDNDLSEENKALTPMSEWFGVMIGQAPQTDRITGDDIFRGYSIARRDKAPLIETEDFRDEAGRNIWDEFSPPHFGFKPKIVPGANGRPGPGGDTWHWNSETFCLAAATRYNSYMLNRIDNSDPAHSKWSAYCSIYLTDEDADGRQQGSYVLRVSGKVDGVRIPKSLFYVSRVMQNEKPDIHIIGHWNYPAKTKKSVFVAASHCDQVELFLNGKSLGVTKEPMVFVDTFNRGTQEVREPEGPGTGYIYEFPNVAFVPGSLKAVATKSGKVVSQQEIQTAGAAKSIKLTLHTGPNGLQADGSDVALIDFEVVDAQGRRCPTDEARVDFDVTGPVTWRGGFNAAKLNTTNNRFLDTECGINRVAVRSTLSAGTITVTAKRDGLVSATVKIESKPVEIVNGLQAMNSDANPKDIAIKPKVPRIDIAKAPAPLFDDALFHGATDPFVIWNPVTKTWYMYYTQRRATLSNPNGVDWVHGTAIGIATSKDGLQWNYAGTCKGDQGLSEPLKAKGLGPTPGITWWAPGFVLEGKTLHMFVTQVDGVYSSWVGKRHILHFTSEDWVNWKYLNTCQLNSERVIDATVYPIKDKWYMVYKDEAAGSHTYRSESKDMVDWSNPVLTDNDGGQEAPFVFQWKGSYWLIVDAKVGLRVYQSPDGLNQWEYNNTVLADTVGIRPKDNIRGHHPGMVLQKGPDGTEQCLMFYFTHQGLQTVIQLAELELGADGKVFCNRNKYAETTTKQK